MLFISLSISALITDPFGCSIGVWSRSVEHRGPSTPAGSTSDG
jgi:hypothetical protein